MKADVLETAKEYISSGLMCIPIHGPKARVGDPGKQPKDDEWQKHRLSFEDFKSRFSPGDNIGVVTGQASGFICVDCDNKEDPTKSGMTWFMENEARLGQYVMERTGSGGVHLFYRYPADKSFVPSKIRLFPGVDFLADGGKQVVTWPSVNKNGAYRFENGLSLLDVHAEAGDVPAWLLEENDRAYRISQEIITRNANVKVDDAFTDMPSEIERCREILSLFPPAIEGEGGDMQTIRAAWKCHARQLSMETTLQLMLELYNPRCLPPWEPKDLARKVKNAFQYSKMPYGWELAKNDFPDDVERLLETIPEGPEGSYTPKFPVPSARYFLTRHAGKVLCNQGQLYTYREGRKHWDLVDDETFESVIQADIQRTNKDTYGALKMNQLADIRKAVKRELLVQGWDDLKPDTWLDGRSGEYISCRNGILDVSTGEFSAHSPKWFSFTTLPFDYAPGQECPNFEEFLKSIWDGDQELCKALQLWMGYMLTSSMKAQKFAIMIGKSRAGKGTLARVMESLVGSRNTAACSILQFGDTFGLEPILGKRLAIFNEAKKVSGIPLQVATERLISITGNDPQPVNRKNRTALTMALPVKVVLVCNRIPPFVNDEDALTNRMIAFPFEKTFKGREDENLLEKLLGELPGIFNWALAGARAIMTGEKLYQSQAGEAKVREIAEVLDSVQGFMSDVVQLSSDTAANVSFVSTKRLYNAYKLWCRDSNAHPHGKKRFCLEFKSKVGDRVVPDRLNDRERTRGYYGIKLNMEELSDFDADQGSSQDEDDYDNVL